MFITESMGSYLTCAVSRLLLFHAVHVIFVFFIGNNYYFFHFFGVFYFLAHLSKARDELL